MNTPVKWMIIVCAVVATASLMFILLFPNCGFDGDYLFEGIEGSTTTDEFTIEDNGYYQFSDFIATEDGTITVDIYKNGTRVKQESITVSKDQRGTGSMSLGGPGNYYLKVNSSGVRWTMVIWDLPEPLVLP